MAIIVSFQNQKGGCQKTTLTKIIATIFHYTVPNIRVAVIDADAQHNIALRRARDIDEINHNESLKRRLDALTEANGNKSLYPIFSASLSNHEVVPGIDKLIKEDYNLIFIDLPGSLMEEGINEIVPRLNFIFTPISSDFESVESSLQYITKLRQFMNQSNDHNILNHSVLFTKYSNNENSTDAKRFKPIKDLLKSYQINVLDHGFFRSTRFEHELAGTIFPFPQRKEYENISPYPLAIEIFNTIIKHTN